MSTYYKLATFLSTLFVIFHLMFKTTLGSLKQILLFGCVKMRKLRERTPGKVTKLVMKKTE